MRILAFEVRDDEQTYFESLENNHKEVEITLLKESLSLNNVLLCKGYDAITILGVSHIHVGVLDKLKEYKVQYIATRTIGYDHIDVAYANQLGLRVCNANYAPDSVADFTIMLILLALRKYKPAIYRQNVNDFSLQGLLGKTMSSLTIGVVGTGKIGTSVIRSLSGFGCKILAYNRTEQEECKKWAEYADMNRLYKECDVLTFHVPLTTNTRKIVNEQSLNQMKNGVILINTARGELMDVNTLITGIENQKIGALAMDVFENENDIYHENHMNDIITNKNMAYLRQFPNVILTQHMAFYTESAVKEMVFCALEGIINMSKNESCEHEISL
jgi:lactate dehydrogenase-like 2-hydroxyacid dehydrogenase